MAEDVYKKLQKARLKIYEIRTKLVVRAWNLAKRLDQSHSKDEQKKKKKNK
ncbi:MAG: hypothetical protein HY219_02660 [Candidatus Staskawiczbacteria bacterium]|nr:hypothetical protein [Candidatus Staskawiczbacteria bacterium]